MAYLYSSFLSALACFVAWAPQGHTAPVAVPVLPSKPVLNWQMHDTGCFVHYNMATMRGSQGCQDGVSVPPPLSAWQPTALDTDAWVQTCKAMGGTRMIYVAKHGCGFAAWKSNVTNYTYSVSNAPDQTDVVAAFVKSARKAGLGVGFYYSDATNSYCRVKRGVVVPGETKPGQMKVTQAEYDWFVVAHLTELWTNYGDLEEIWFDGGYHQTLKPTLTALLQKLQPNTVVFGGAGLNSNALRWIGTEDGLAPYPAWSRNTKGSNGKGDPDGAVWEPAETDFTLQNKDNWFYNGKAGVHTPAQLRQMYEQSSGSNTGLIIDIAPFPNGSVPAPQAAAAAALGKFVRGCYGAPAVTAPATGSYNITIKPSAGGVALIDRIQIREDQRKGQIVRAFILQADRFDVRTNGMCSTRRTSIGNKYICVLDQPISITSLTLQVTDAQGGVPNITQFSAYHCGDLAADVDTAWAAEHQTQ